MAKKLMGTLVYGDRIRVVHATPQNWYKNGDVFTVGSKWESDGVWYYQVTNKYLSTVRMSHCEIIPNGDELGSAQIESEIMEVTGQIIEY